jgi:hypothetical protein
MAGGGDFMNQDIKTFLDSYENMVGMYEQKVAPDNQKLREVKNHLGEMARLGESCSTISEFMERVSARDMMNIFTKLLTELAGESLKRERKSGEAKMPSARELAVGYHKSYEAIRDIAKKPRTQAVYDRIFALEEESGSAIELLRRMSEEGLVIKMTTEPLIETTAPLVMQAEDLSLPSMAFHHERVIEAAEKAGNSIELEYETQKLVELNRAELMCDTMLCNDLVYLLGNAVSSYLMSPTGENRQYVENCYAFVADFFGIDINGLFDIPRVRDVAEKVIIRSVNRGEGGRKYTLDSFIREQVDTVLHCVAGKNIKSGPPSRGTAVLWGKKYPLKRMQEVFRHPDRGC